MDEITELIADGAAHEKDHIVFSYAFTVTHPQESATHHFHLREQGSAEFGWWQAAERHQGSRSTAGALLRQQRAAEERTFRRCVAFQVEPMKREVKVPGFPGGCRSGCCRSLVWAGLVSAGRWS